MLVVYCKCGFLSPCAYHKTVRNHALKYPMVLKDSTKLAMPTEIASAYGNTVDKFDVAVVKGPKIVLSSLLLLHSEASQQYGL